MAASDRLGPSRVGTAIEPNGRVDAVVVVGLSRDRGRIGVDTWDRIGQDK